MKTKSSKNTQHAPKNFLQVVGEYVQALLGALLLAILIRGFVFEPFRIPSESMVPTLLVGDHIFVQRYKYGLRVPFTKFWLTEFDGPKRGDVVVFTYPINEDMDFIKRVIGLPGDKVSMKAGILYINDVAVKEEEIRPHLQTEEDKCLMTLDEASEKIYPEGLRDFPFYVLHRQFRQGLETIDGQVTHLMQHSRKDPKDMDFEYVVPPRAYFVMGDNRDQSDDSRFWGVVPRDYLKGKAVFIWLSLNFEKTRCAYNLFEPGFIPNVRWDRFGRKIM